MTDEVIPHEDTDFDDPRFNDLYTSGTPTAEAQKAPELPEFDPDAIITTPEVEVP